LGTKGFVLRYLIDFLESQAIQTCPIYEHLKCSEQEALVLQMMTKEYVIGNVDIAVSEILIKLFGEINYEHLKHLPLVKELIEQGWVVQNSFLSSKSVDISNLELLNSTVTLSSAFLKLLEEGTLEVILPDVTPYADHLEYLKDQFFRIELYQKLGLAKHNATENAPSIGRIKSKLELLESRIVERIKVTHDEIVVESIFKENELSPKEQLIFLALLKEEYAGEFESLRDMNTLISLISVDDYEKIKNRSLLEEG